MLPFFGLESEIFNLGQGGQLSKYAFLEMFLKEFGMPSDFFFSTVCLINFFSRKNISERGGKGLGLAMATKPRKANRGLKLRKLEGKKKLREQIGIGRGENVGLNRSPSSEEGFCKLVPERGQE